MISYRFPRQDTAGALGVLASAMSCVYFVERELTQKPRDNSPLLVDDFLLSSTEYRDFLCLPATPWQTIARSFLRWGVRRHQPTISQIRAVQFLFDVICSRMRLRVRACVSGHGSVQVFGLACSQVWVKFVMFCRSQISSFADGGVFTTVARRCCVMGCCQVAVVRVKLAFTW